jgi:CheY-like chemotaxis protein
VSSKAADLMSKKPKILLAEDEPCLRLDVQTILSRWDCEVLVEQSAEGAIHRAAVFGPEVALLGFITPGMTRLESSSSRRIGIGRTSSLLGGPIAAITNAAAV